MNENDKRPFIPPETPGGLGNISGDFSVDQTNNNINNFNLQPVVSPNQSMFNQDIKKMIDDHNNQHQTQAEGNDKNAGNISNKSILKRECNAALDEPTAWKINLFSNYVFDDEEYLRCGDVLWLHHSESNTCLAACRREKGVDKYNFSSLNLASWLSRENLDITAF